MYITFILVPPSSSLFLWSCCRHRGVREHSKPWVFNRFDKKKIHTVEYVPFAGIPLSTRPVCGQGHRYTLFVRRWDRLWFVVFVVLFSERIPPFDNWRRWILLYLPLNVCGGRGVRWPSTGLHGKPLRFAEAMQTFTWSISGVDCRLI